MRRKRVSLKIRSSKRLSKKLLPPYASYALVAIVLFLLGVFFYSVSSASSPPYHPSNSLPITNHSSLSTSTELPHSISFTNHSSLSASPPPPGIYTFIHICCIISFFFPKKIYIEGITFQSKTRKVLSLKTLAEILTLTSS